MKYLLILLLISCVIYHLECLPTVGPISRSWGFNLGTSTGPGWGGGIGGIYPGLSVYPGYPNYSGGYGSVFSQSPSFPGYVPGLYGQGYLGVRG